MSHAKITWNAVSGFELDLEYERDDVKIIMAGMPLPADGTVSLGEGVKLFSLDALFRSEVDVDGAPGQLSDVRIAAADGTLSLAGQLENADTMERRALAISLPVTVASQAPESGGPVHQEPDEDSVLDDESDDSLDGLSALFAAPAASEAPPAAEAGDATPQGGQGGGLAALLRALAESGDDEPLEDDAEAADVSAEVDEGDDGFSALAQQTEALSFLELLVGRELLELEDGYEVGVLVEGTAKILAGGASAETKATKLSTWLFSQEAVGELYAGDEELETLIDAW